MMNMLNNEANQTQKRSSFFESTDPKPTAPKPEGGGQAEHREARTKPVDEVASETELTKKKPPKTKKSGGKTILIPRGSRTDVKEIKMKLNADTRQKMETLFGNVSPQVRSKIYDEILNLALTELLDAKEVGTLHICYKPEEPEEIEL